MSLDLSAELERFDADEPIASARTPPASWYTTQDFLNLEKETVFRNSWQFVGLLSQLREPGDYFSGIFLGWPYVVCLNEEGGLQAFYNVCSHHGTCIATGSGNRTTFVCPYHGWTYGLKGQLLQAPRAGKMASLKTRNLDLKPVPVTQWGPFIALHFGKPQHSLAEQLTPLIESLSRDPFTGLNFVKRISYEIPCNWKVYIDNYLDGGYHVPHMHPGLSDQLNIKSYTNTLGANWSIQACGGSDTVAASTSDDFKERIGDRADYSWIYPNFMFNRYGPWLDTNWVIPLGVDSCLTVFDYFYEGQPSAELVEKSLAASHQVQEEDIAITQMVQTGLTSGIYQQGIYAPRFEMPMLHFHRLLAQDLKR